MFRPICKLRTREREYADLAIDIYTGCNHGCEYCYVKMMMAKFKKPFSDNIQPIHNIIEATKMQISKNDYTNKKIMLCFKCDPYPSEIDTTVTREIIKIIKESKAHIQILTKGGKRAERDFDLLNNNDSFGVTISGCWHDKEPLSAFESERLQTLKKAYKLGIKTWVSCEPVYDSAMIYHIIKNIDFIDFYRIGKLNYLKHPNMDWKKFGQMCEELCIKHNRNYYIKEDLRNLMNLP